MGDHVFEQKKTFHRNVSTQEGDLLHYVETSRWDVYFLMTWNRKEGVVDEENNKL